jgi:methylamine dehydrogenase accessory protein MauD
MTDALLISAIASWLVIICLCISIYALTRQIGVLHERLKPVGALSLGKVLAAGSEAPKFQLESINGGTIEIGGKNRKEKSTLIFFLSSTCPVCKVLLPSLLSLKKSEPWLNLVFASDGDPLEHKTFIDNHRLGAYPYILSTEMGITFQISKLPYGVLIDENGVVSSHGLINNREHLESLFEAKEKGVSDVHSYNPATNASA